MNNSDFNHMEGHIKSYQKNNTKYTFSGPRYNIQEDC